MIMFHCFSRANFWMGNSTLKATVFHETNIAIHSIASVLCFLLCDQVLHMNFFSCFTASAIFAVHPIHTEAVSI